MPSELLKQTFFTQDEKKESTLEKHGFEKKLRDMVSQCEEGKSYKEIIEYMKTLSPSGIELEIITLASFDMKN